MHFALHMWGSWMGMSIAYPTNFKLINLYHLEKKLKNNNYIMGPFSPQYLQDVGNVAMKRAGLL
jgi:hypothetical protein